MPKNLPWRSDEIILALNLYFDLDRGPITSTNPKIIALSEQLNKLKDTIHINDPEKFRNPNGICLKLSNFLALDPSYDGKGMTSYSKLDAELFKKYNNDKNQLKKEVIRIESLLRKMVSN